jgi:ribosomal protein S18 acetylase RimI-like enzyme
MELAVVTIRNATASDLGDLLSLEEQCFDPVRYTAMSRRQFSHHTASPNAVLRVAEHTGTACGYALGLLRRGQPWLRFYSLAVSPAMQGGDVGRLLFADMEEQARLRGLGVLCEVREDNERLRRRYAEIGYTSYRSVPGYYPDGAACVKFKKSADKINQMSPVAAEEILQRH